MTELAKILRPSDDAFDRDYLKASRPLVIKNLFDGEPIASVRDKVSAVARLGRMQIPTDKEYDDEVRISQVLTELYARHPVPQPNEPRLPSRVAIADYFEFVAEHPGTRRARVAFHAPAELQAMFQPPTFCAPRTGESSAYHAYCFIGDKGSFSQVHFDKDGTNGLIYELIGTKRFMFFPPAAGPKLAPLTQFGGAFLHNMTDADRRDFLRFTGGQEVILGPGDCALLPAFCWHFADYLEDCWSVNIRFRRPHRVTELVNHLYPDQYMQGIGSKFIPLAPNDTSLDWVLDEVRAASGRSYADGRVKTAAMRELARSIYSRLHPEAPTRPYLLELESHFPSPLPEFTDAHDPRRPRYE